ncbi:MAG TPA: flagellar basal body L-ring protein FlgH [Methylophilaceae bacterium]|nr:flagellar basal body L-ring protein FlgH [Methylophilaceae bacterium]HSI28134.1 flagellar basal body L-ring protein FlgH [Methylophilus sp.]
MFNTNYRTTCNTSLPSRFLSGFCARLSFNFSFLPFIGLLLVVSGCAITPDSIIKQPNTARPPTASPPSASSGAIFNSSGYRPLFEDRRPRYVGDIVTINITENTSATKAGGSSASKDGKVDSGITAAFDKVVRKTGFTADSELSYTDKAAANSSNVFTGSITASVVEVLPNGYLVVSGEKQISFDKGTEFVRFSGIVNPDSITLGNFVPSTKVADARIEYRTNSRIDASQVASIIARFFLSLAPL